MNLLDIILLVLIGGFALFGLWFGFVHTLGSLVGTIFGAFLASRMYGPVAQWLNHTIGGSENAERIIVFLILFVIFNRLIGVAFSLIENAFRFISVIPFLKTFNRLLGALLGIAEGVLVIGLTLYVAVRFPFPMAERLIEESQVAHALLRASILLIPLLPRALRAIQQAVTITVTPY